MTRRTALTSMCLAVCLGLPSGVLAQYDPFGLDTYDPGESYRQSMDEYYERRDRQNQILEDAMRPFQRDPLVEWLERDTEDRIHAREACMAIDRNPAAQQRCLDGLR